ncbi:MAG: sialate O-acetylesterase [Acidobacteriaceae bacterium]|nr:sialate O-acetylesterase [Acidobacteriaceae bacterium]
MTGRGLLLFAVAALAISAQEIRIVDGPKEEQVLQRSSDNVAECTLKGTVAGKKLNGKTIEVRVRSSKGILPDFDWTAAARIDKTVWTARVKALPTGGPYRIEARIQGTSAVAAIDNVLVGDLWILAGQSNMEGLGDLVDVQSPDPLVHTFDMADRWRIAEEPLHNLPGAADRVHWRTNAQGELQRLTGQWLQKYEQERKKGAGLGLPFAVEMVKRTGIPIGLVPCAHGGTSMDQWSPAYKDNGGDSLYGSMYRRFLEIGGHVKGVLWYQGESDATPKLVAEFKSKFETFVKTVRSDFNDESLPFYYVQIGRHISDTNLVEWNRVQEAQLEAEKEMRHVGMVAAVDLSLDDGIHVSTPDLKRLGRRLADRVSHDLFPRLKDYGDLKPGPRPVSATFDAGLLKVQFEGVNRRLIAEGRISGFSIHDAQGRPVPAIYKASVDPAEASTVLLYISGKLPEKATLRYGYGKDPYCNVRDGADMAIPAFGPLEIRQITAAPTGL